MLRPKLNRLLLASTGALIFLSTSTRSVEITPFRITGIETELTLAYFFDEYVSTDNANNKNNSYRSGNTFQEELDILIHSYIYHPNFVLLDFGGGPVFLQNSYDSDLVNHSTNEQFFNFHAKANILKEKNYPFTLYYDRNFSSSSAATQDRMLLERSRYGIDFSLKNPFVMAPLLDIRMSSQQTDGSSIQRKVDEASDQASVVLSVDLGPNGDGSIGYYWLKEQSSSGSYGLPIAPTSRTTNTLDIQAEHTFGENRQILFNNFFTYKKQDSRPSMEEISYRPSINWTHAENLTSYYRYTFRDWTTEQTDSQSNQLNLGVSYYPFDKRLHISAAAKAQNYQADAYNQDYLNGSLSLSYLQEFNLFNIRYSTNWAVDRTDRQAASDQAQIFSEHHILNNTTPAALSRSYVITGSVKISNLPSTQVYVENIDYRLIVSGDTTSIQRIPTGNIVDGEEVQVDYSYETGGTAVFTSINQRYRIDLNRGQYIRAFAQYHNIERSLDEGSPTLPLNSSKSTKVGFNFDLPFWDEWSFGGRSELERYEDEIVPYDSTQYGLYVQMPTPLNGRLRIFADRELVDRDGSPEDTDLTRWGIRYNASPWRRSTMSINVIDEEDTGGTKLRSNTSASLRFDWKIRQLKVTANARYNSNSIGDSDRERTRFDISISRRF